MNIENACDNCGICQCLSCKKREHGIGFDSEANECGRCDNGCEDMPMHHCQSYEYCEY